MHSIGLSLRPCERARGERSEYYAPRTGGCRSKIYFFGAINFAASRRTLGNYRFKAISLVITFRLELFACMILFIYVYNYYSNTIVGSLILSGRGVMESDIIPFPLEFI